jgi:hypothetical protein
MWFFFVHSPAKDKQIVALLERQDSQTKMMMESWAQEREKDRTVRHDLAATFRDAIAQLAIIHDRKSDKDRVAFESRNAIIVDSIETQTGLLVTSQRDQTTRLVKEFDNTYQKLAALATNTCRVERAEKQNETGQVQAVHS